MKRLKVIVPYVVFLVVSYGLVYMYGTFFSAPPKPVQIGTNHFEGLGQEFALLCLVYPLAIILANLVEQLKPRVLLVVLAVTYVIPVIYTQWMLSRMNVTEDIRVLASMYGPSSQEMWLLSTFGILTGIVLPVLILVLVNHLTNRSTRTREGAPVN